MSHQFSSRVWNSVQSILSTTGDSWQEACSISEPHLPLPNPTNTCNTRSLAACLFIKTNPDTVALPFFRGNCAEAEGSTYPSTPRATFTSTEAHLHRFSTHVSCQKLHQLSQSCKLQFSCSCTPMLLFVAEIQIWDLTGLTRRDVCIGMPWVRQHCLHLCFYMVTVGSRNKLGSEMLDFFPFQNKKRNFWACRSFLPLFPTVLNCARMILVSLKCKLFGLCPCTDHCSWLIIHLSICCDKLAAIILYHDGVCVILGQYVLSVTAIFLQTMKTCQCICLFNHTHPPTSFLSLGTTLKINQSFLGSNNFTDRLGLLKSAFRVLQCKALDLIKMLILISFPLPSVQCLNQPCCSTGILDCSKIVSCV